ncbi:DUF1489 family protein [Sphingomonas ginkgonis]|uniref:DUF1489 family protein n=1 Tax=Sphingomonas ginkgonis TaxID=2315330 RepID=A0A3R9WM34_9SPHN|nr:DUF1489 family protein [Sphingomonas ginkgonis]RST29627.1 DUF1489 family protein [Sphingomonas ginkgonis]
MSALHLSKVAIACRDLESLARRLDSRREGEVVKIVTRMRPKRCAELVGGCIYWIVQHRLIGRQEILGFEDREDGRINILCDPTLQGVPPAPMRAHQGWRYLKDEDAPQPGANDDSGLAALPPRLYGKLVSLALL